MFGGLKLIFQLHIFNGIDSIKEVPIFMQVFIGKFLLKVNFFQALV